MGYPDLLNLPNSLWKGIKNSTRQLTGHETNPKPVVKETVCSSAKGIVNMNQLMGSSFIRIAGVSGAVAVAMGAYGTHAFYPRKDVPDDLKDVYRTANYYHFLHTLALLGVPLTRRPFLIGALLTLGMTIFCGTCYYTALSGDYSVGRFTPNGGMLLIFGWLSMML